MNPSFWAYQKGIFKAMMNIAMGIPHVVKPKKSDGKLFADKDGGEEIDPLVKEANTRAHLNKLAHEAKARYFAEIGEYPEAILLDHPTEIIRHRVVKDTSKWAKGVGYPNLKRDVEMGKHDFPRSDMIVMAEEEQERRDAHEATQKWVNREMARNACIHTGERRNIVDD